ncbi:MAG: sugar ABC transporter permease [Propionibacteriaceae bacterium]|jgi:putative multiple sugar transport system permease protein|nr:sugar ABC transporter permease [Propionibacteriaceae bacterium]
MTSTIAESPAPASAPEPKNEPAHSSVGSLILNFLTQNGILVAFVFIFTVLSVSNQAFLSPTNLTNIVLQYSYVLILAIGMLMVIVAAQIDLSVGSVLGLTGAVASVLIVRYQTPWWVAVLAALAVGLVCGAWQGFWVAVVGIPGFIVSLGGMLLFRGLTYKVLSNISLTIPSDPDSQGPAYASIANGFFNGILGGDGFDVFTVIIFIIAAVGFCVMQWRTRQNQLRYNQTVLSLPLFIIKLAVIAAVIIAFGWQISHDRGLPYILIILAFLIMAYTLVTQKTSMGRSIYAVGGNMLAAQLSGVKVKWVNFWVFVNMGFLAGVAGVVYSARMSSAQPGAGDGFELDAIAACFIGGASTLGGVGRVTGAMIGGLIMAVLNNGMQLMGFDESTRKIVKGLVLLLAVAFDLVNKRRAKTS